MRQASARLSLRAIIIAVAVAAANMASFTAALRARSTAFIESRGGGRGYAVMGDGREERFAYGFARGYSEEGRRVVTRPATASGLAYVWWPFASTAACSLFASGCLRHRRQAAAVSGAENLVKPVL